MFPNGLAGAGLLLIRVLCVAVACAGLWRLAPAPLWFELGALAVSAAVLLGLRTRLAAVAGAALSAFVLVTTVGILNWAAALLAVALVSLAMIGPGAYSIDARLFGRKVITFGQVRQGKRRTQHGPTVE